MILFFSSRNAARQASFGKFVDNGPESAKGERYGRYISGVSGNASQRRKIVRAIVRGM